METRKDISEEIRERDSEITGVLLHHPYEAWKHVDDITWCDNLQDIKEGDSGDEHGPD